MYTEEKFTLRSKQKTSDNLYIEGYGKRWGEKLTFTVGITYFVAATYGLVMGVYLGNKAAAKHRQLRSYHVMTTIGKTATRYGNASAAASLLYCLTGKSIDLIFEEELQDVGQNVRNIVAGGVTGLLYKSTKGLRPMAIGSLTGAALISGLTYTMNALNDKGIIGFRMDV